MTPKSLLVAVALLLVQLISSTPLEEKYSIKLDVPEKVGDTYHVETTVTESTTSNVTVAGQFAQKTEESAKVELSADVVIEAAANNWATRKRFTVLSSTITKGTSRRALVPERTVLVASIVDGRTVYEIDGRPVDEQTATSLRSVISLHTVSVADDGLFGTTSPRAVGESWPISTDAIKGLIKEIGVAAEPRLVNGSGRLEKVENNHIVVSGKMHVQDVLLVIAPQIPPGNGEIRVEYLGRIPVSKSDLSRAVEGTIYMLRVGTGANENGQQVRVEVIYENKSKYEIRPVARMSTQ